MARRMGDLLMHICLAAITATAIALGAYLARQRSDLTALARPVRAAVPGEYRGPTVPEVIDHMNRRGDRNPADVLDPD